MNFYQKPKTRIPKAHHSVLLDGLSLFLDIVCQTITHANRIFSSIVLF